jgi:hypothetical protein
MRCAAAYYGYVKGLKTIDIEVNYGKRSSRSSMPGRPQVWILMMTVCGIRQCEGSISVLLFPGARQHAGRHPHRRYDLPGFPLRGPRRWLAGIHASTSRMHRELAPQGAMA